MPSRAAGIFPYVYVAIDIRNSAAAGIAYHRKCTAFDLTGVGHKALERAALDDPILIVLYFALVGTALDGAAVTHTVCELAV